MQNLRSPLEENSKLPKSLFLTARVCKNTALSALPTAKNNRVSLTNVSSPVHLTSLFPKNLFKRYVIPGRFFDVLKEIGGFYKIGGVLW